MSDLVRLLDGDGTDRERDLLGAAGEDRPGPEARQATLAALGLGGSGMLAAATSEAARHTAVATGQGTSMAPSVAAASSQSSVGVGLASASLKAAAPVTTAWLLKWFGGGTLAGLVAAGVAVALGSGGNEPERAPAPIVTHQEAPRVPVARTEEPAPVVPPQPVEQESAAASEPAEAPRPAARVAAQIPPSAAPRPRAEAPAKSTVFDEVAVLDAARGALSRGDAARAVVLLDEHRRRFPSGALGPEATVLRVRAELGRGNARGARQLAARFLAAHPESPHAAVVRDLVGKR